MNRFHCPWDSVFSLRGREKLPFTPTVLTLLMLTLKPDRDLDPVLHLVNLLLQRPRLHHANRN